MSLVRAIRSHVIRRFADEAAMHAARARAEARRQARGAPHEVLYFHQPDDPYSQLAVQLLPAFAQRYAVRIQPRIVAGATPIAIHDQALWQAWARRECALIVPHYGLQYRDAGQEPAAERVAIARRVLLAQQDRPGFAEVAAQVSLALQANDLQALIALAQQHGATAEGEPTDAALKANFALRHRLGHYLGGMFYYAGEWYWGLDRLHHLEARLDGLGARRSDAPAGTSAQRKPIATPVRLEGPRQQLEFFCSLRSPYTHLSYRRVAALCKRYPLDLVVRPVIPMMMRGVKADRRKGQYIIFDTAREARQLGVPFGKVWDPFGKPVLRAYSLFPWARQQGRGFEYLESYSNAVWAEGVNAWSLTGLRHIVERAGLSWSAARQHLDNSDWRAEIDANADDMIAAGSWGVPSFRLAATPEHPALLVWGQDRLWLIEAELARRYGAAS